MAQMNLLSHYAGQKSSLKVDILYDSIYIALWIRQNYSDGESVVARMWWLGGVTTKGYKGCFWVIELFCTQIVVIFTLIYMCLDL